MSRLVSSSAFWNPSKLPSAIWGAFRSSGDETPFSLYSFSEIFESQSFGSLLGFSSGRAALLFSLQVISELRPESKEVIVPLYVCSGVIDPIIRAGLTPIFCDIGKDLNICPDSCFEKISDNTLAIIVPHTYGYPAKIQEILDKVKCFSSEIFVIDDAASGMGTRNKASFLGMVGDVGIFSLNQGKAFSATGGGLLSINRTDLKDAFQKKYLDIPEIKPCQKLTEFLKFYWNFYHPHFAGLTNYYFEKFFDSRILAYQPLYGHKLSIFDYYLVKSNWEYFLRVHHYRKEVIDFYCEKIEDIQEIKIPQLPVGIFLGRFCVHIPGLAQLKTFSKTDPVQLFRSEKIYFQYGYPPFAKKFLNTPAFESSFKYIDELLILPINHRVPVADHGKVVDGLHKIRRNLSEG